RSGPFPDSPILTPSTEFHENLVPEMFVSPPDKTLDEVDNSDQLQILGRANDNHPPKLGETKVRFHLLGDIIDLVFTNRSSSGTLWPFSVEKQPPQPT